MGRLANSKSTSSYLPGHESSIQVGLNRGNQPVPITLPEPLQSGSSVTIDEHPYIRIDLPELSLEEPGCTTLPLGGVHSIPVATTPKNSLETKNWSNGRGQ